MHVLITGASKGIGYATAEKLIREGYATAFSICSRSRSEIDAAAAKLSAIDANLKLFAATCDVSEEGDVTQFVREAESSLGAIDVLVNNSGFGIFRTIEAMTTEEFDRVIATDLRGVFLVTKAVLPSMMHRGSGSIVTISSLAGKNGFTGGSAYCAAKFAVRGLMQSLFLEVRDRNIRVTTIFPGSVDTAFFSPEAGSGTLKSSAALSAENIADAVYATLLLPATADISELDLRPTNPKR